MYADDAKIYLSYNDSNDFVHFQADIDRIGVWAARNQLKVAFDKCSIMHIGYGNQENAYSIDDHK
jgi:hypothetical protein